MAVGETIGLLVGLLIDGIGSGLILAMLGLGITLVFGLGGVLNLSQGVFSIIGILIAVEAFGIFPNVVVSVVAAFLLTGIVALAIDRSLLPLVYRSEGEERMLVGIFVTLGLAFFLEGLLVLRYPDVYAVHAEFPLMSYMGGNLQIRGASLAVIAISVVVFAVLYWFFDRTYVGQATRTVMQDEVGATLCGIDTRMLRTYVFILSAMVAAIAGALYSLSGEVQVASGFALTINAVIVSVVGGVTSISGTVLAGLALGIITTFASAFIGAYFSAISLFVVAIAVLVYKPEQIA